MHSHEHAYLNMIFLNNGFENACLMSCAQSHVCLNLSCLCFYLVSIAALDDVI